MVKLKNRKRQIELFGVYSGRSTLNIEENRSTHYSAKTDRQIKIPLPGFDEYYRNLNRIKGTKYD